MNVLKFIRLSNRVINASRIDEIDIDYEKRTFVIYMEYDKKITITKHVNKYDYYIIKNWIKKSCFYDIESNEIY